MSKIICIYSGDGEINKAFDNLKTIYFTNYQKENIYGIIFDSVPSISSFMSKDKEFINNVEENFFKTVSGIEYNNGKTAKFFCAVRKKKYFAKGIKYKTPFYRCENGIKGAESDLFSYISGDNDVFLKILNSEILVNNANTDGIFITNCGHKELKYPMQKLKNSQEILTFCGMIPKIKGNFYYKNYNLECTSSDKNSCAVISPDFFKKSEYRPSKTVNLKENQIRFVKKTVNSAVYFLVKSLENDINFQNPSEILKTALSAVCLNKMGILGNEETLELSEMLQSKLEFEIYTYGNSTNCGENLLLIVEICGFYSELGKKTPCFYILKSDLLKIGDFLKNKITELEKVGTETGISKILMKEINNESGEIKTDFLSKLLLYGENYEEFLKFANNYRYKNRNYLNLLIIFAFSLMYPNNFIVNLQKDEVFAAKFLCLKEKISIEIQSLENKYGCENEENKGKGEIIKENTEKISREMPAEYGLAKEFVPYIMWVKTHMENKILNVRCEKDLPLIRYLVKTAQAVYGKNVHINIYTEDIYKFPRDFYRGNDIEFHFENQVKFYNNNGIKVINACNKPYLTTDKTIIVNEFTELSSI